MMEIMMPQRQDIDIIFPKIQTKKIIKEIPKSEKKL
jgi:hypothetical protein